MSLCEEVLAREGYRVTSSRRAIAEVLSAAETPLAPQEIYERGRTLHPRLGLVTVYRTVELFEALGLVSRVHHGEGCHGYVLSSPGHRHVLLCRCCGRAMEFLGGDDLEGLIGRVEGRTGYRVDGHLLQLAGVCPGCQE